MTLDRRSFSRTLLLGAGLGIAGFPKEIIAAPAPRRLRATLVLDAATGRAIHRSGSCATRFTPCSTFKIPLALIGFDSGILKDAHHPAIAYDPRIHEAHRAIDKQRTDPTSWELNSVVWYSQALTRQLGMPRFQTYIDRLGYGNRDLSGEPGKHNGLTHAWLGTSLKVSCDEQAAMLRAMLARRLPVSASAQALTQSILPIFPGAGGWTVHGKTGSGRLGDATGLSGDTAPLGWFVGWATRGKRRLVFACFEAGDQMPAELGGGMTVRRKLLRNIAALAG